MNKPHLKQGDKPENKKENDMVEIIYFALNNWDMNPMTKGFAKELAKEIIKSLCAKIESKAMFVNAYKNGPLLKDSIIITIDEWLKIKRNR